MNPTELKALAARYVRASHEALGNTKSALRRASPMPFPLNDEEVAAAPEQWQEYFSQLEGMTRQPRPKARRKR